MLTQWGTIFHIVFIVVFKNCFSVCRERRSLPASWALWILTDLEWSHSRPSLTLCLARRPTRTPLIRSWHPLKSLLETRYVYNIPKNNFPVLKVPKLITKWVTLSSCRTISWWMSCGVSSLLTRPSTASPAWRLTPALTPSRELLTTCPSPPLSMGRVTSEPWPHQPAFWYNTQICVFIHT